MHSDMLLASRRGAIKFSLFLSALLFNACSSENNSNSKTTNDKKNSNKDTNKFKEPKKIEKIIVTENDILAQRSAPILNAIVIDSRGKIAIQKDHGIYRFKDIPELPVYLFSGIVDLNNSKKVTKDDLKNTLMLGSTKSGLVTILTSLAAHDEKIEWLKNSFKLTDDDIYTKLPKKEKKLSAICDEIYSYCINNNQTKPSKIPLDELEKLKPLIDKRIKEYSSTKKSASELEKELAISLKQQFVLEEDLDNYKNGSTNPKVVIDALPKYELNDNDRYALAFMWNEERLAGDAYWAFHATLYDRLDEKEKKIADRVLKTIEYSERLHQATVEDLMKKYDVDILHIDDYDKHYSESELRDMKVGQYPIKKLQSLWDNVAPIGTKDLISALRVGCIAEIGDIEDLDRYIEDSGNAVDLRYVYEFLRAGSILHYWAFDKALKELGVSDGACSIESRYCKRKDDFEINGDGGTSMSLLEWVKE